MTETARIGVDILGYATICTDRIGYEHNTNVSQADKAI